MKLHKRQCYIRLVRRADDLYGISLADKDFHYLPLPSWEVVSLWYQIGEVLGFDTEDAKHELEQLHWRHEQGELDEQRIFIDRKASE